MASDKKGGNMAKKRIVALGGDGIGPEVVDAACHVLEHAYIADRSS